jgi:opacity protein-like surface antigen
MRKTIIGIALFATVTLSGTAMAHDVKSQTKKQDSPQWNTLDVGYSKSNIDLIDDLSSDFSLDGVSIRATTLLNENYFLTGSYSIETDSNVLVDIDYSRASAELGYLYAVSKTADIYTTLSYEYVEIKTEALENIRESGMGISLGARKMITPSLEIDGKIKHINLDNTNLTSLRGEVHYYITERVSLGANYEFSDMHDTMGASVRYTF